MGIVKTPPRTVPHSRPTIGEAEIEAVARVMRSGHLAQGPEVEAFEQECAEFVGRKYAVAVSSGTAALHLALGAVGVDSETRIALPAYACASLLTAVTLQGGTAALCDVGDDFNLDPTAVPAGCPVAIVPHLFGAAALLPEAGIVMEDIAQSIGGGTGQASPVAITSFYATKMLTTGEGGMVLTDDEGIAEYARDRRDYDNREDFAPRFAYKMTDVQAAMGRVQLKRLPEFVKLRRAIADRYTQALGTLPLELPRADDHVYFRYVIRTEAREALEQGLNAAGIEAKRPVYKPAHQYFRDEGGTGAVALLDHYPGADSAHEQALSLPIHPSMDENDVNYVIESISGLLN